MPYTTYAKDEMLQVFSDVYVGLLHGQSEETDPAYQRQRANMGRPSGNRQLENISDVHFPPYATWPTSAIDGFTLYDLSGVELVREPLPDKFFEKGDAAIFRPGDLIVKLED